MTKAAFDKIAEGLNEALEVAKADAPSRIYATVNGASTRLLDGGRQMIGGWRERPDSPRTVEYIRADLVEGMRVAGSVGDHFSDLVQRARAVAKKASAKFPQPNYVTLKIAEEAGEVVRGAVHYAEGRMSWAEVEGEIVQLLAMLMRFVNEGDQVNGVTPPTLAAMEKDNG